MKKLLILVLTTAMILCSSLAFAGVTVTRSYVSYDQKIMIIRLACVGDGAGAVSDTTINGSDISEGLPKEYTEMGFYLYEVWAVGGSTLPDAADIDITLSGVIKSANIYSEDDIIPASTTPNEGTLTKYNSIYSYLTVAVTNQGTASAIWDIYLVLVR